MLNNNNPLVSLVDCPRDAIQGIKYPIDTQRKINYINLLIKSKLFDCIDFGSFVSPKAVPQMSDTSLVLDGLEKTDDVKLLAIIANERGARTATELSKIDYLGYPFSISETFQQRNTNASIEDAFSTVQGILDIIHGGNSQELVVYISMAFGNPYGDEWSLELVSDWIGSLKEIGVERFSIADTTGEASPSSVSSLFRKLANDFPNNNFSVHLHSQVESALLKVEAAYEAGCRQFEGAILGYGGCPFAKDELVGNIPTELLVDRFRKGSYNQVQSLMNGFQDLIRNDL